MWCKNDGTWVKEDCLDVIFSNETRLCITAGDGEKFLSSGDLMKNSIKKKVSRILYDLEFTERGVEKLYILYQNVNSEMKSEMIDDFNFVNLLNF